MYIKYMSIYKKYSQRYVKCNILSIYVKYVTFVDRTRIVNMFPTTPITPTRLCKLEILTDFFHLEDFRFFICKSKIFWNSKIRLKLDEVFTNATPSSQNEQVSPISMISSETVVGLLWCELFSFSIFTFWAFWSTVKIPARL